MSPAARAATPSELNVNTVDTSPDNALTPREILGALRQRWKLLTGGAVAGAAAGLAIAFAIPPTFTARTLILPPQQSQSSAAAALSSLGSLAGLAGGAGALKSPADQYVAMMQSATVGYGLVDEFRLIGVYEVKYREDAFRELMRDTRMLVGKKDGLITVEVDSRDPRQAAAIANAYVERLRGLLSTLAVSEAQQRRLFFEQRLRESKDKLTQAQTELQNSGFNAGAIKSDPKAAAEGYARLRAELTFAEVKLQSIHRVLTDGAPELLQQEGLVNALRAQIARLEQRNPSPTGREANADYVSKYREFKYQETLFDLFARQYEAARVDESREGALVQVVDAAQPPERKSKPPRGLIVVAVTLGVTLALGLWAVGGAVRQGKPEVGLDET
jgi:uncharacterized protein involved in exopolysaccharide biosynthesis